MQLGKTVESIIEVGRLLIRAKAELPHGEFGRLFNDHLVPFGQDSAERLMAIAKHPLLSNSAHGRNLPPSWRTLYELTKADQGKLKIALKDGVITPDLTRREMQALLPAAKTPRAKSRRESAPFTARTAGGRLYFQIARLLSDEFDALSPDDQESLLSMLDQSLADLRERQQRKETTL